MSRVGVLVIALCLLTTNHSFAATIVLDPGHGGSNPGAIGVNQLQEKDVNFAVTLKLRDMLSEMGYNVLLTREHDVDMSLDARVKFKEKHRADLFVSIHANAHHDAHAQGSLVLYYDHRYPNARYPASAEMARLSATNRQFAQSVLDGLLTETQYIDQGVVPSSVYVVRKGTMPSILVELAFLTNWEDATRLADDNERERMARGIANGIEAFWPLGVFRDIAGHWAASSITKMQEQGIVNGVNQNYYPDRALTRAEFLTIMDRVFHFSADMSEDKEFGNDREIDNQDNEENESLENKIERDDSTEQISENNRNLNGESGIAIDVDRLHWAYETIEKAIELGIVNGYPDGTIRPDAPINRAEVSVLFDRIWQTEQSDTSASIEMSSESNKYEQNGKQQGNYDLTGQSNIAFIDVPADQWYAQAILRLANAALVKGVTETMFAPYRQMTRAEIATVIDRFFTHHSEIVAKSH